MSSRSVPVSVPGLPHEAGCAVQPSCSPSLQEGRGSIKAGQRVVPNFWGEDGRTSLDVFDILF